VESYESCISVRYLSQTQVRQKNSVGSALAPPFAGGPREAYAPARGYAPRSSRAKPSGQKGFAMARSYRGCLGAVLAASAATLISCSPADTRGAPGETDGQASPSPSPSPSPSTLESERHAYRLEVPPGWDVSEYGGTWRSFKQFSPGGEVPGEDVLLSPDGAFLVANSMAIPSGMTHADWLAELTRLVRSGRPPDCSETTDTGVLAGEPAMIMEHRCEGMNIIGRSLTHGGRGYYFTIGFQGGDPATAAILEGTVSSIRFIDG
jgi:hypothetical protein